MTKITEELFLEFFEKHHPDKMKFKPKLIEVMGDIVIFGMRNHSGRFCVNVRNIISEEQSQKI